MAEMDRRQLFSDLGYEPHVGQWRVHDSKAPRRVLACGVRWGKTKCAAMEAIAAALEPKDRAIGWVVAPTYDLADRVFREVQIIALEKLRHRVIAMKESDRRLILRNLGGGISEVRGKSADNPVSLLGEGLDFVIIDEAARLKPEIWQSHLTQRLIDKNGWALLISTPRGKGYVFDLFQRGQRGEDPTYESWNSPSWENPHLDREVIEAERARLPARVFDQEYGAKFVEGSGAVFRNVRECATGVWQEYRRDRVFAGGLDLAKVEDFTVITIVNNLREVVFVDRFHRIDWQFQVQRIVETVRRFHVQWLFADGTGVGDPICEALAMAGCPVVPIAFTKASKNALISNLALLLERREIVLPKPELWPEGIEELESFEYSVSSLGNTRMSAPSGRHDYLVISLALAAWPLQVATKMAYVEKYFDPTYRMWLPFAPTG